ncbi:MAG: hypothetical protein ACRDRH_07460 [Pseudonocardia sp.]
MTAPLVQLFDDPRPEVRDREGMPMLLHEALARSRQREAEEAARRYRLARSFLAGRRWAQLAGFATRRAAVGSVPSEARVARVTGVLPAPSERRQPSGTQLVPGVRKGWLF